MLLEKNPTTGIVIDVFGPTVEFLTSFDDERSDFCVLKGTIPPKVSVPLHSHADTEAFVVLSGAVKGLQQGAYGSSWIDVHAGDLIHVPPDAPHAWRNDGDAPVVMLIFTTCKMACFFREVGRPLTAFPQPPTPEELAHFAEVSARYGYWNASPEENAAVGIDLHF